MITPSNETTRRRRIYPFAAIVGQEQMKHALLLNAVCPRIGGVLIRGEKGTAKSTAARGLAELLPPIQVTRDCAFNCDPTANEFCSSCRPSASRAGELPSRVVPAPFVDLPLGATEDMVLGSIDFESAIRDGIARLQPGLLARSHRGVLYVDEVNLLCDHLVDGILCAAESGLNLIEREGMSAWHPSRFALIGTMNPEEGELRPQLLDRFGLAVEIHGEAEPAGRVRLLRLRERFDLAPDRFERDHASATVRLREKVLRARELHESVHVPKRLLAFIAEICARNHVAGHRADLAIRRAASAHAALDGRVEVTPDDITAVAPLALLHRMRPGAPPDLPPPPPPPEDEDAEEDENEEEQQYRENEEDARAPHQHPPQASSGSDEADGEEKDPPADDQEAGRPGEVEPPEEIQEIGRPFKVRALARQMDRMLRTGSGRRSRTRSANKQGRYVRSTLRRERDDLALDATLRAAAPHQRSRKAAGNGHLAVQIQKHDIREKIRERRVGNTLLFLVDGSGSMGAQRRMVETKAAVMSLLLDAYQKRDTVSMVVFRGREAGVLLPPTSSVETAARLLAEMPVGGRTPLSAGLSRASEVLDRILRKDPTAMPLTLLLTDGRANASLGEGAPHLEALKIASAMGDRYPQVRFVVVDTEPPGAVRLGLAGRLAAALGADYFQTENLRAEELVKIAREQM